MKPEEKLPRTLLEKAVVNNGDIGWRQSDFIEVVETACQLKMAIIGGQVQYALPDGTCELHWLSYDTEKRFPKENWADYCERTAAESIAKFKVIISGADIEKEAIDSFEFLSSKNQAGINIDDFLTFIVYFENYDNIECE